MAYEINYKNQIDNNFEGCLLSLGEVSATQIDCNLSDINTAPGEAPYLYLESMHTALDKHYWI